MSGISDLNCDLLLGCLKNEFRDTYEIAILHVLSEFLTRHLGCNVHPEREKYRVTITKKTYTQRGIDLPARPILSL